jgi:FlgD Ig-like domain
MDDTFKMGSYMRILIRAIFILPMLFSMTLADPGLPDTLRIDSVGAMPGSKVMVPVFFYNDEVLSAAEIVLTFDSNYVTLDSFSLKNGRLSYIPENTVFSQSTANLFDLSVQDWLTWIPRGNGLFCNLYFSVSLSAGGQTIIIDSSFFPPLQQTMFTDSTAEHAIFPQFVRGYITVGELPPNQDSVWVDTVTSGPGRAVAVNVYGFNEDDLTDINLALTYSSDNLIFDSVIFDNTRGATAYSRTISPNAQNRQLLIALSYSTLNPLTPGSGPLAKIIFDIKPSAPDEIVIIDSASYLGIQRLEFLPAIGLPFAPYFRAGYVNISLSSPVDDRPEIKLPKEYLLAQNYPNPFNPATVIGFALPKSGHVTLDVFNILGQKIRTIIDRQLPAGTYNVTFDGRGDNKKQLASGVYFYRLKAAEFTQSRPMMLLK